MYSGSDTESHLRRLYKRLAQMEYYHHRSTTKYKLSALKMYLEHSVAFHYKHLFIFLIIIVK